MVTPPWTGKDPRRAGWILRGEGSPPAPPRGLKCSRWGGFQGPGHGPNPLYSGHRIFGPGPLTPGVRDLGNLPDHASDRPGFHTVFYTMETPPTGFSRSQGPL
jgi:hypothetical protein